MTLRRGVLAVLVCAMLGILAHAQKSKVNALPKAPELLPWSQQIAVREGWLVKRHAMLLDMRRRHNIDMWIVVNEEFHCTPESFKKASPLVSQAIPKATRDVVSKKNTAPTPGNK
jgi:Xaa-Pro dipeptidase